MEQEDVPDKVISESENCSTPSNLEHQQPKSDTLFKKPILIGKVGRFPRKVISSDKNEHDVEIYSGNTKDSAETTSAPICNEEESISNDTPTQVEIPKVIALYKEPPWSGLPHSIGKPYMFEIIKSGVIIGNINLMGKTSWLFGRLQNCDIVMSHPTVSRYHAVLQYRNEGTANEHQGFYIYDLGSTHGTFLNKSRLKSKAYVRVKVGHRIKVGCSTRYFLLTGPDEDTEEESALTITELKVQRATELLRREEDAIKEEKEKAERLKRDEEKGIDWGMGEDAEEESDLHENPFAQTNNEELYIDDPKKALRGFMEREGYNFEYDCKEQGFGQFLCKVELPIDDDLGRPLVAEVLHKGKKKEAVLQCALEACRILDRHGLLRQATHESRKRKAKNWEENDFYDSDDDTFLDRTGSVEMKREKRMNAKVPQKPETHQSLVEKEKKLNEEINAIEKQLNAINKLKHAPDTSTKEDPLDEYMKDLAEVKNDKYTVSKLKSDLLKLKQEHANVVKLIKIVKPANLPALETNQGVTANKPSPNKMLPLFGKRKKLKVQLPAKQTLQEVDSTVDSEEDEVANEFKLVESETKECDQESIKQVGSETKECDQESIEQKTNEEKLVLMEEETSIEAGDVGVKINKQKMVPTNGSDKNSAGNKQNNNIYSDMLLVIKEANKTYTKNMLHLQDLENELSQVHSNIKDSQNEGGDMEFQYLATKYRKVFDKLHKLLRNDTQSAAKSLLVRVNKKLYQASPDKDGSTSLSEKIEDGETASASCEENESDVRSPHEDKDEVLTAEELEKKKKKNQRRIQQRQGRVEIEKRKGYDEDAQREGYDMWIPPRGQTGDGRTSLNEKFGY